MDIKQNTVIMIDRDLKKDLDSLKIHERVSCKEIVRNGINLLIQERNLIEQTKLFKDFRILKARRDFFYCSLCGKNEGLLCEGRVSRETLGIDQTTEKLYFCQDCLKKAIESFNIQKDIKHD